jgi:hypothetical protein
MTPAASCWDEPERLRMVVAGHPWEATQRVLPCAAQRARIAEDLKPGLAAHRLWRASLVCWLVCGSAPCARQTYGAVHRRVASRAQGALPQIAAAGNLQCASACPTIVGAHLVRDRSARLHPLRRWSRTGCAPTRERTPRNGRLFALDPVFARRGPRMTRRAGGGKPAGWPAWMPASFSPGQDALSKNPVTPPAHLEGQRPGRRVIRAALSFGYFSLLRASCPPPFGPASPFARAPARAWASKEK